MRAKSATFDTRRGRAADVAFPIFRFWNRVHERLVAQASMYSAGRTE